MKNKDFLQNIGGDWIGYEDDRFLVSLELDKDMHLNAAGTVHGGVLCTMLDAAMGIPYWDSIRKTAPGSVTLEIKVNFHRGASSGVLKAYGKLIKASRRIGYVEGYVEDESGNRIASGTSTHIILEPR